MTSGTHDEPSTIAGFLLGGWYAFSNFAAFQILWRGKRYATAEHAYQAAHFFTSDPGLAELVRSAPSPEAAFELANLHSSSEDSNWRQIRLAVMEEILRCKLAQHEYIQTKLLATKSMPIVEMNDADPYWGWGADHEGQNQLGKLWMKLRSELQA